MASSVRLVIGHMPGREEKEVQGQGEAQEEDLGQTGRYSPGRALVILGRSRGDPLQVYEGTG